MTLPERLHHYLDLAVTTVTIIWIAVAALLVGWVVWGLVRFIRATPAAKRSYWLKFRVRARWRRLTLALGLVLISRETVKVSSRKSIGAQVFDGLFSAVAPVGLLVGLAQSMGVSAFDDAIGRSTRKRKVKYPRVRVRADEHGVVARVRTVPGVGREDFEKAAQYLADAWRVSRVQVFQAKPGRLIVRGIKSDPLAVPLSMDAVPTGVYAEPHPFRPYLGRDEWATDRWLDLSGITGITVGGLARYGKTSLILSLLMQLGGTRRVQFVFLDGKGSGQLVGADYDEWVDRAWMASGDDLVRAEEILKRLNDHMMERGRVIRSVLGVKNGWHVGPSDEWPLIVLVVDECHTFFDEKQATSPEEKKRYLRLQSLAANLPRKSGSVMMLSIFLTQKQTGDAIPTAIRDNCTIGLSFATKTRDAAVAALGEGIREARSLCPTTLKERPTFIGCCTAALPDGMADFIRLRVPHVVDEAAADRSAGVAQLRTDPDETLAALTVRSQPSFEPAA